MHRFGRKPQDRRFDWICINHNVPNVTNTSHKYRYIWPLAILVIFLSWCFFSICSTSRMPSFGWPSLSFLWLRGLTHTIYNSLRESDQRTGAISWVQHRNVWSISSWVQLLQTNKNKNRDIKEQKAGVISKHHVLQCGSPGRYQCHRMA